MMLSIQNANANVRRKIYTREHFTRRSVLIHEKMRLVTTSAKCDLRSTCKQLSFADVAAGPPILPSGCKPEKRSTSQPRSLYERFWTFAVAKCAVQPAGCLDKTVKPCSQDVSERAIVDMPRLHKFCCARDISLQKALNI